MEKGTPRSKIIRRMIMRTTESCFLEGNHSKLVSLVNKSTNTNISPP
jgi:hypothetical protein